jgi:hypothetical protein
MITRRHLIVVVAVFYGLADRFYADHATQIARLVQPLVDNQNIVGCVVGLIEATIAKSMDSAR